MRKARAWASVGAALALAAAVSLGLSACGSSGGEDESSPHVVGKSREAIGKYLVMIGGCNDCHTPGAREGKLPEEAEWLTGSPVGWNGPWGTTYAPNLRLKITPYNETTFIAAMRKRFDKPPMPWSSLHAMNDADLGAVYAYIKALGPAGRPMPEAIAPGVEPAGPYAVVAPPIIGNGKPPSATSPATAPLK